MTPAWALRADNDDMAAYPEAENYRDAVRKYRATGRVHKLPSGKVVAKVRGYSPQAPERFRALTESEYGDIQSVRQQLRWAREAGDTGRVAQLEATLDGLALPLRRPFTVIVGGDDPAAG
jgi:thioester reductase-like protein